MSGDHRDLHVLTHSFPTRRPSDLIRVEQRGAPFLEAVEQVEMARKGRAIGDLQPAAPGKYIDFLDLGRLQLQRLRIAAPCGAHRPCFCNRTDDNPVSADKIGYISIISCNINILHRMLCERSEEPRVGKECVKTCRT